MYAYVLYANGGKAVVSTKLVKKFSPKHSADFDSESLKTVYWKSYGASADEGYYKARIQLLAGKFLLYFYAKFLDNVIPTASKCANRC